MHNKSKPDTTFTAVGFAVALVFGIVPLQQARSANAPSPFPPTQLEMRVPFEPTTYSRAGRNHLTYELYLTNFSSSPVTLRRIDVLDADDLAAAPIATYEAGQLDTLVQPIGHQTPAGGNSDPHQLAGGATVVVFLWIALDHGTRVPNQLRHRILTGDSVVEGAVIGTHHTELKLLGPPVTGTNWLADDGPSNDQDNHHRRGILVFEGRAQISRRYAIDWQQSQNGKTFSGDASDKRSYYAYGKPLLAVADGTVVTVRDGLPDNVPRHNGEFTTAVEMTADTIGDQGALGTGLFKSYEVVLNYPNRTLTLVQRADGTPTSQSCQGSPVPFSPEWHGEAVTTIDTDLGQLTVCWDTGTTTSVLSKRFVQRARPNLTKDALTTQRLMIGTRNFGPMKFEIWEMALPPGFDGFMGYSFFARHVVCIDYPDKQVLIR